MYYRVYTNQQQHWLRPRRDRCLCGLESWHTFTHDIGAPERNLPECRQCRKVYDQTIPEAVKGERHTNDTELALRELDTLHGLPLLGKGASIKIPSKRGGFSWLSGIPYFFSAFNERAFIFPDERAARTFIEHWPGLLSGAEVVVWS